MKDPRGVERGRCTRCSNCTEYKVEKEAVKCINCKCPPGVHENLTAAATQGSANGSQTSANAGSPTSANAGSPTSANAGSQTSTNAGSQASTQPTLTTSVKSLTLQASPVCSVQGCTNEADFDLNTGTQQLFCSEHLGVSQSTGEDIDIGLRMMLHAEDLEWDQCKIIKQPR